MEAVLNKSGAADKSSARRFSEKVRAFLQSAGHSIDRYLNRLYESLPKDRPNV